MGSYVFATKRNTSSSPIAANTTISGGSLYPAAISGGSGSYTTAYNYGFDIGTGTVYLSPANASSLSGTWRAMGSTTTYAYGAYGATTLFVRIS